MKTFSLSCFVFFLMVLCGCGPPVESVGTEYTVRWTMVNVNSTIQGDAHLIRISDGKTILIDTGTKNEGENELVPYLIEEGVQFIDVLFVTHPHFDHYGGVIPLLESGITVSEIVFNLPEESECLDDFWGCRPVDIANIFEKVQALNIPLHEGVKGMQFDLGNSSGIEILYAFNKINSPVEAIDMNDESLILLFHHDSYRFLFAGDLNEAIGSYLAENGENLQADILKMPHHGTAPAAPAAFFDVVSPSYALVPSSADLWCSDRSAETRSWVDERHVPVYVGGFHGYVDVYVTDGLLRINTQYDEPAENICLDN